MDALEWLGMVLGLVLLGAVIALALAYGRSERKGLGAEVEAMNRIVRELSAGSEFRTYAGGAYQHPVVGSIPVFEAATGTLRGFPVSVGVESQLDAGEGSSHLLRIQVRAPERRVFNLERDDASVRALKADGFEVRCAPDHLVLVYERSRSARWFSVQRYALPADVIELGSFIERAVALAASLAVPALPTGHEPLQRVENVGAPWRRTTRKTILLVESDRVFAEQLRDRLQKLGASVVEAGDAEGALTEVRTQPPDLILLSAELPGASGWELNNRLKREDGLRGVPVVILSSDSTEELFETHRGLAVAAEDYVRKPIAVDDIMRRIRRFL